MTRAPLSSIDHDAFEWTLASNGDEAKTPSFLRLCLVPSSFPVEQFSTRIHIMWSMREANQFGLPVPREDDRLETFEELLTGAVGQDAHAILVLTITGNSMREFVLYAKDVAGFMDRLQRMPHPDGMYPISLEEFADPDWEQYRTFAGAFNKA